MNNSMRLLVASCAAVASVLSLNTSALDLSAVHTALAEGKTQLSTRYRYEFVDQENIEKSANASTALTRLSYKSASLGGAFTVLEVDNVTAIGNENFNSTVNGNTQYPVVADPIGTEVNQAYLGYKTGDTTVTYGRQRILHNNQRFVGGVAWRQNEQTYDALRVLYKNDSNLTIDYSYVYNVNRIFGTDSPNSDLPGDLQLFNAKYAVNKQHTFTGYAYNLDFENVAGLSSRTLGVSYDMNIAPFSLHAAVATQTDTGENPNDFSAQYLTLEGGYKFKSVKYSIGYESLGSDNGVGFSTPLATLHKFQGFADQFLATPGVGVNDLYVKAVTKVGKVKLVGVYHQLESDVDSIDFGNELNLVAVYPLSKKTKLLFKYAGYSSDDFKVDTEKFWAMVTVKF